MNRFMLEATRIAIYCVLPVYWIAALARYHLAKAVGTGPQTLKRFGHTCGKVRATLFGYGRPLCADVSELYTERRGEFEHQHGLPELGVPSGQRVQDVIVVDNFYEDPDAVRRFALGLNYITYASYKGRPFWFSSALEIRDNPIKGKGVRLANEPIKVRLAEIIRCPVDDDTWETSGDGWNGAFHYKVRSYFPGATSKIHNHAGRDSDVREGWSGLVYLSKDSKGGAGTSIWRDKKTGLCYSNDSVYTLNHDDFELMLNIENRYNRLVLFYANVFHVGEEGFGTKLEDARLFQTFFFNVRHANSAPSSA